MKRYDLNKNEIPACAGMTLLSSYFALNKIRRARESGHPVLLILLILFTCLTASAQAADIREVISPSGIKAWLVEDHKLPLVALHFAFRGGTEQDPADKQGLANLTMNLLSQGAGSYDAAAFQQQLADHSIEMAFGAGRDSVSGSLKALSSDKAKAFELLSLALTQPRFDAKDVERLRAMQLTGIRQQLGDPNWQARYALLTHIYGAHPYGERRLGSEASLAAISRADIASFAAHHMARDNLIIAVAGDMTVEELSATLDRVFGALPAHAQLAPIEDAAFPGDNSVTVVRREGVQSNLMFALAGPKRNDPSWYATEIANYILGGGGFSSRLMQDVRDKKGLTYGITMGLSASEHSGLIIGEADTDNARTGEAWKISLETMHNFYDNGVTAKEIGGAKDYLTGSLALALTSTDKIASILVNLQLERLGIDFLSRYSDLIRQVSADDVAHAIERWFNPDRMVLVAVGKPDDLSSTQTKDQVRE
jgi:zinc protease